MVMILFLTFRCLTEGVTPLAGAGGRIRADLFTNKAGTGAPTFQTGVVVTGVATARSFEWKLNW